MTAAGPSPSTPRLSKAARRHIYPDGIVASEWSNVRRTCEKIGVTFDPWQEGVGTLALGLREDGKYAATVGGVVLSIPRQVGKTFLVGMIVIALSILFPGLRVIWSAHRTRTSTLTFRSMQAICRRKKIWPYIASIRTTNGEQEIAFRNGSLVMFGAREQGFGRGFEELDIEVFDEAQILTTKALEDMVAAANQARHPHGALLFFIGTPPRPIDPGEEFSNRRDRALSGRSEDMVYVEFGADPDADLDDREQWAKANPSYPLRTPTESMLRLRANLTDDDSFRREGLGIWDAVVASHVLPPPSWASQEDAGSVAVDRFALGVEVGPDLKWASVSLAGQRQDGDWHGELEEDQHTRGRGVDWLVPHLQSLTANNPQIRAVVGDVGGPVASLLEKRQGTRGKIRWFFKGTLLEITPVTVSELGSGCAMVLSGIVTGWLHHIGQPQLTVAALAASKRRLGDTGMWVWSRQSTESDITPIQSLTLALIGAQKTQVQKPARTGVGRSGSGNRTSNRRASVS